MRLFPQELEITETEGFDPQKDIFDRKPVGEGLQKLFSDLKDPLVLAIDGPWGSGKSTFLKMWAGHMRQQGYPVIYYDAFRDDHVQDAFLALAGQVGALAKKELSRESSTLQRYLSVARSVGGSLLRRGARVAITLGTGGILRAADLGGLAEEVATTALDEAEQAFNNLLDDYLRDEDLRAQFAGALRGLAAAMASDSSKPLIFIIDELDRCRPNFALEILENVKHFFSVPGVNFVLGAHVAQLQHSIVAAYGAGIDARTYLQKFIHVQFQLPLRTGQGRNDRRMYVERLARLHQVNGEDQRERRLVFDEIGRIASARNLSFRQIERICAQAILSLAYLHPRQFKQPEILACLITLRVLNADTFAKALDGRLRFSDIGETLAINKESGLSDDMVDSYTSIWKYYCGEEVSEEDMSRFTSSLWRYNMDRNQALLYLATIAVHSFTLMS